MAAALAKVLRSGRSAASSHQLLPAILPRLGSSQASPAAGMGRAMHTGLFRTRGVRPQEQLMRMEQSSGKRFMSSGGPEVPPPPHSFVALGVASAVGIVMAAIYTVPGTARTISSLMK
uniref:Uncharacterized protein n=1 Tax=Arundo donax TaxID=35708 RepID=A0A0A9PRQ9_ARUDO